MIDSRVGVGGLVMGDPVLGLLCMQSYGHSLIIPIVLGVVGFTSTPQNMFIEPHLSTLVTHCLKKDITKKTCLWKYIAMTDPKTGLGAPDQLKHSCCDPLAAAEYSLNKWQ